jgi:rubredoxin
MNAIAIVELKRYGWRQKIIKSFFVITGDPPYVESFKPKKTWKKVIPKRKCRKCYVGQDLFVTSFTRRGSTHLAQTRTRP